MWKAVLVLAVFKAQGLRISHRKTPTKAARGEDQATMYLQLFVQEMDLVESCLAPEILLCQLSHSKLNLISQGHL